MLRLVSDPASLIQDITLATASPVQQEDGVIPQKTQVIMWRTRRKRQGKGAQRRGIHLGFRRVKLLVSSMEWTQETLRPLQEPPEALLALLHLEEERVVGQIVKEQVRRRQTRLAELRLQVEKPRQLQALQVVVRGLGQYVEIRVEVVQHRKQGWVVGQRKHPANRPGCQRSRGDCVSKASWGTKFFYKGLQILSSMNSARRQQYFYIVFCRRRWLRTFFSLFFTSWLSDLSVSEMTEEWTPKGSINHPL